MRKCMHSVYPSFALHQFFLNLWLVAFQRLVIFFQAFFGADVDFDYGLAVQNLPCFSTTHNALTHNCFSLLESSTSSRELEQGRRE